MKTKNKKLLNRKANREYYSKSDGNFMTLEMSLNAHKYIDRIAWVRENVHKLGSRFHLDLATKDGYLPLLLASEGVECIGVDSSEDAIDAAKLKALQADVDVSYLTSFIEDLPLGYVYDTVSMLELIEHVVDVDKVLEHVSQMGEYIFISTPDYNGKHGIEDSRQNDEHVRLFTKEELETLLSKYGELQQSVIRDGQLCIYYKSNRI